MERSSPSRTAGVVVREATIAGEKYLLTQPDTVGKAAEEESVIIAKRLDMYEAVMQSVAAMPEKLQERAMTIYIDKLVCGIASVSEWDAYYKSWWKLAFDFWSALHPRHKRDGMGNERTPLEGVKWAYEKLTEWSNKATKEEFDKLKLDIRIVSQRDLLGESSGLVPQEGIQQTAAQTSEATQPSINR